MRSIFVLIASTLIVVRAVVPAGGLAYDCKSR
jgi:hypothetical protein